MGKKLNVYYAKVNNMGDNLNKAIIEKCFGYDVNRTSDLYAKICGIGSCLSRYTYGEKKTRNIMGYLSNILFSKVYIWGTGFLTYGNENKKFYKKNINFCAVRGELTKKTIENIQNRKYDIPLADAGILASYLIEGEIEKKYDLGIIPHFREKDEKIFSDMAKQFDNSIIIDVQDDPTIVTKKIAQCKCILSSSLHGLIIADSLRIPNKHILVTNKLLGDGFKFDDYYSAYNLKHEYIDLNKDKICDIEKIMSDYKITDEMVKEKKELLLGCFPYPKIK